MDFFYSVCFHRAVRFEGLPWLACFLYSAKKPSGVCKDERSSFIKNSWLNFQAICYVHYLRKFSEIV